MANLDQPSDDDVDALVSQFGGGFKTAPKSDSASASKSQASSGDDDIEALASQFSGGFKKKGEGAAKTATTAPTDEYEARVQKFMPEAEKRMKALGTFGGVETGISRIPIVGPIMSEIGADISAALPSSISEAEGDTFSERRQNIKAGLEAMKRAGEKQNPYVSTGTEIAGSFALPVGGLAGIGEAATGSKIAGLATEGAGMGALTSGAEKIGTKSEKDMPDVGESTLIGGGLGAGLGVIGKGVSKAVEKVAPDWMKAMGSGRDNFQMREFSKAFDQDVKDGTARMTFDDYQKALEAGQPVAVTDLGGPRVQEFIKKAFHDQPELARDFQLKLNSRLSDASRRFDEFAQNLADSDLNVNAISSDAKALAKAEKQKAYDAAYAPDNGRGAWKSDWNEYINLPIFKDAIRKTEDDLANDVAYGIGAAKKGAGEAEEIVSPFKVESVSPGRPRTQGGLEKEFYSMEDPSKVNIKYLDYLQRNLNDAINGITGNAAGGVKARLINIRNDIVDSLTNPESDLYNPNYAKAFGSTQLFRGENDAFTYGRNLLSSRRNAAKSSEIQNATAQMTEPEKKFFMQGVLADMLAKSRNADGSINTKTLQNFFTPGPLKSSLENAFSPQQFQDLQRFANTESVISEAAQKAMGFGGRSPQISRDLHTIMWSFVSDRLAMAKFLGQYANQFMGDRYAKSLIQKLMSNDANDIRAAYDDLYQNKALRSGITDALSRYVGRGGILAGEIPGHKKGGRVGYNNGGGTEMDKEKDFVPKPVKLSNNSQNWPSHKWVEKMYSENMEFPYGRERQFAKGYDPNENGEFESFATAAMRPHKPDEAYMSWFQAHPLRSGIGTRAMQEILNSAKEHNMKVSLRPWEKGQISKTALSKFYKKNGFKQDKTTGNMVFDPSEQKVTRSKRATGGRIPEADKLFKAAKREIDGATKPLMQVHDDHIVHALRIAKGII